MTMWLGYCFCLASDRLFITSTQSKFESHFVGLRDRLWTGFLCPGVRFSKDPKTLRAEKSFVKLRLAYSVKLVFSYVVKRIKIKITSKFRASRGLCFDDTKRIMSSLSLK